VPTVSREELYEQVWSRPMTKVAAEYGVTSTALKKTCDRHQIPTPERGYWAKLAHGKPVRRGPLPALAESRLDRIRISGDKAQRIAEHVRKARTEARGRLELRVVPELAASTRTDTRLEEARILGATRRDISKARLDEQGFATAQGRGIVSLKISPRSIDRALQVLTRLFCLAEIEGYRPKISAAGLDLATDDVSIAFGLQEQSQKILRQPTAAELKGRDDLHRGPSRLAWPKYDYSPSGRLAIIIHANSHSGLRRTYSDGKTQSIEAMLPEIVAALAEHAALLRERRRAAEERAREHREAEIHRQREEAFNAREKRRMEFVDAIHEQLLQRSKLSLVLDHLESFTADKAQPAGSISAWVRRRIQQIDALTSPQLLDISARFAKVDFAEATAENTGGPADHFGYLPPIGLQFWSIDEEKELATSISALEWAVRAGAVPQV
jgi:hypothetical protein